MLRQRADQPGEHVTDFPGGVPAGQMPQEHVPSRAFHKRHGCRSTAGSDDQITLSMPGHRAVLDLGRPFRNHHHVIHERGRALAGMPASILASRAHACAVFRLAPSSRAAIEFRMSD
jgi:hypothetical protein